MQYEHWPVALACCERRRAPIMQTFSNFTPWLSLLGGGLIGLAASLLLIGSGRVAGISGIAGNLLLGSAGERLWRAAFVLGLMTAGLVFARA
jgi:uncharacterized protein